MVIIRWPGSKFVPKNGPKNSPCEPIYEKSPRNSPPLIQARPKKSSPARRGYKPIKIIQVDAFGVALNPMVESEWMFGRNIFYFA